MAYFAVLSECGEIMKECEKIGIFLDLVRELEILWNINGTMVLSVVGALGGKGGGIGWL